ncbi:MAG: TetR/AcrR family transcriptional regulator [Chitinophagaceae bacterium]|nr:TetR/AcrR family transcriptional regulator [Chitinophagaceae bacterium]
METKNNIFSARQLEIIEAAGKLLSHDGIASLTTKNLAKEMGFSESAIYRHFKGKEDIIVALLNYLAINMDERLTATINKDVSPLDNFTAIFKNQFNFFKKNKHFIIVTFSEGLLEHSAEINDAMQHVITIKIKHLLAIFKQAQQQNLFTDKVKPEDLIHIVMGSFRLLMFKWRMDNFKFDIVKKGDQLIHTILLLIKK